MSYVEVIVAAHNTFYPNGGSNLELARFYANLAILLAKALESGEQVTERDMVDFVRRAEAAEKDLARGV